MKENNLGIDKDFDRFDKSAREQASARSVMFSITMLLVQIAMMVLVLVYLSNRFGLTETEVKGAFVIYAVLALLGVFVLEWLCTLVLLRRSTRAWHPLIALKSTLVVELFNRMGISNYSGRTVDTAYLNDFGVEKVSALCTTRFQKITNAVVLEIFAIVAMIVYPQIFDVNAPLIWFALVGLAGLLIYILYVIIMCSSKRIAPAIVLNFYVLLQKMNFITNYQECFDETMRRVFLYKKAFLYFKRSALSVITTIVSCLGKIILEAVGLYFIIRSVGISITIAQTFSLFACLSMIDFIIPLPFSAGILDLAFLMFMTAFSSTSAIWWALLIYRIVFLYVPVAIGFIFAFIVDILKTRRLKMKQFLAQTEIANTETKEVENTIQKKKRTTKSDSAKPKKKSTAKPKTVAPVEPVQNAETPADDNTSSVDESQDNAEVSDNAEVQNEDNTDNK